MELSQNIEMALIQKIAPTVHFIERFANCRIFVLSSTFKRYGNIKTSLIFHSAF